MAQAKSDNYDVVGGIFDFLFEESRKPPKARKPIKPKGGRTSTTDAGPELVDGIMAALAAPGVFVSDSVVDAFNDATDIALMSFDVDQTRRIKIGRGNIRDLIKDPKGFVQKQSNKAKEARKAGIALFLGSGMEDVVTTAWSRKYGNLEVQKATLAMSDAKKKEESFAIGKAMGQYMGRGLTEETKRADYDTKQIVKSNFMEQRSLEVLGEETFGNSWGSLNQRDKDDFTKIISGGSVSINVLGKQTYGRRWENLDEQSKANFIKNLNRGGGPNSVGNTEKFLASRYGPKVAKSFDRVVRGYSKAKDREKIIEELRDSGLKGMELERELSRRAKEKVSIRDYKKQVNVSDPKLYKNVEETHLKRRIAETEGEEKRLYQKTLYILKGYKSDISKQIDFLKGELRSETDPQRRKQLENEIKESRQAIRVLNTKGFAGGIGRAEGYLNSVKGVWLAKDEGVFNSIFITQYFFDARRNTLLNPVEQTKSFIGLTRGGKGVSVDFLTAKKTGNVLLDQWNEIGEKLYYYNPKTWINSLYKGEGFAWVANRKEKAVGKILEGLENQEFAEQLLASFGASDLAQIDKTIVSVINKIKLANKDGKISPAEIKKIEAMLKSSSSFKKLAKIFNAPTRWKGATEAFIKEKLGELRKKVAKAIFSNETVKRIIIKYAGQKALDSITKLAASATIKTIVQSIATTIGAALGLGAGSVVTGAITWIVTEVVWQVGKVFVRVQTEVMKFQFQFFKILLLGVIALFLLFTLGASDAVKEFNKIHYPANQAIPGTVETCDAYNDLISLDPEEGVNCRKNLPIPNIPCLNVSETIRLGKIWTGQSQTDSTSNIEVCLGDVIQRAQANGVDPIFTIAIWIHESGASNYDAFSYPIEDFGIHGRADVPTNDFNAQINFWLNYTHYVASICPENTLENFIAYYWFGNPSCKAETSEQAIELQRYIDELQFIYDVITDGGSCATLPNWPSDGEGGSWTPYTDLPDIPGVNDGEIEDIFKQARAYVSSTYSSVSTNLELVNCDASLGQVHPRCEQISWAWCWSGASIYCRYDKLAATSDSVLYNLFIHELIHQIQGGACVTEAGEVNVDMREWGADFLSNNGGSYWFEISTGCVRATSIWASSCSQEQIVNVALCWDNSTQCFSDIRSKILSRFCN